MAKNIQYQQKDEQCESSNNLRGKEKLVMLKNHIINPNLTVLNLSKNKLTDVSVLSTLRNLQVLDLSYNNIECFNEYPEFCHNIYELDLSYNNLRCPPIWIWTATPDKLNHLNLSANRNITSAFVFENFAFLLEKKTHVNIILMFDCGINKHHAKILGTFPKAKIIEFGMADGHVDRNYIDVIPFEGVDKCCDIERLGFSNLQISSIEPNIDMYKRLVELDLSNNYIGSLPNEFYNLCNLKICILSMNYVLYITDDIIKLKNLIELYLDNNKLCMIPENIFALPNLKVLDLYNNDLYEVPDRIHSLEEIDLAQNFFDEPDETEYLEKRDILRMDDNCRFNGRKIERDQPESVHSSCTSSFEDEQCSIQEEQNKRSFSSESEDWDTDEYWEPQPGYLPSPPQRQSWLNFVKKKMMEGNFCPMDAHAVSVYEKVLYDRKCNPQPKVEVDGQFSDHDSS